MFYSKLIYLWFSPTEVLSSSAGLDFQLPSEQLQLSDEELFGTAAVQNAAAKQQQAPASLHDVIHFQLANRNIGDSKLKPSKEFIESLPTTDVSGRGMYSGQSPKTGGGGEGS